MARGKTPTEAGLSPLEATISLLALVNRADLDYSQEEKAFTQAQARELRREWGVDVEAFAMATQNALHYCRNANRGTVLYGIAEAYPDSAARHKAFQLAVKAAWADKKLGTAERDFLTSVAKVMDVPHNDLSHAFG